MKRRHNKKLLQLIRIVMLNGNVLTYVKKYKLTYNQLRLELMLLCVDTEARSAIFHCTTTGLPNGHLTHRGYDLICKIDNRLLLAYSMAHATGGQTERFHKLLLAYQYINDATILMVENRLKTAMPKYPEVKALANHGIFGKLIKPKH